MKRILLLLCCAAFAAAQVPAPDRTVSGNILTSTHDPAVRIRLPEPALYVGAERWILYDIADCEVHVFVDADARKNVKRFWWIQFEGYLPSKPGLRHDYDSPRHVTVGGLDFFVDTWLHKDGEPTRKGSDREHITALIRSRGYRLPEGTMDVRLVHLLDEQTRQELMIIYSENLSPTGHTAAELSAGGGAFSQWPGIEKGLIERAQKAVTLEPVTGR